MIMSRYTISLCLIIIYGNRKRGSGSGRDCGRISSIAARERERNRSRSERMRPLQRLAGRSGDTFEFQHVIDTFLDGIIGDGGKRTLNCTATGASKVVFSPKMNSRHREKAILAEGMATGEAI